MQYRNKHTNGGCYWAMMRLVVLLGCCTLHLLTTPTLAYSNGAGGCEGGKAAVGGRHLEEGGNRVFLSGQLFEGQVSVNLNNEQLIPDTTKNIRTQMDYTLTVRSDNNLGGFKGILIRLEGTQDVLMAMEPADDTILHTATACMAPAYGLTHKNNSEKGNTGKGNPPVSAILNFDAPGAVQVDITIVGANNDDGSVYGYNGFQLIVEGERAVAPEPSPAPSPLPEGQTYAPSQSYAPAVVVRGPPDDVMGTMSPTYNVNYRPKSSAAADNNIRRWWLVWLSQLMLAAGITLLVVVVA